TFKKPPMILGHEASGTVAELGEGVTKWKPGDRVLLPAVLSCGTCKQCRMGRENICETMRMFGNHVDGAYAEYVLAPAKDALAMPEGVPLIEGSIIADAISTPFHAVVNRAQVRPGDWVAVFGCGGVGINVVQVAAAVGASVIAIDKMPEKLELAKGLGAQLTINPDEVEKGRVDKAIRKLIGDGVDVAFEAIGNPATIVAAYNTLRVGGTCVVIGYTHLPAEIPVSKLMFYEQSLIGSLGCRPVDYPRIIEMARIGKIKVKELVTAQFPLERINDAFDLLRKNDPKTLRSVIVP
ncbi:MAG: zinc-binding dehydrogenase, partial [Calditrichota bacterium]